MSRSGSDAGARKPTTLAEAVEILQSMYSEDELASFAAKPRSDALCLAHFQLGLWIRNAWIGEKAAPLIDRIRKLPYPAHPDDISGYILEALWRVLNGESCPTIEETLAKRFPLRMQASPCSSKRPNERTTS